MREEGDALERSPERRSAGCVPIATGKTPMTRLRMRTRHCVLLAAVLHVSALRLHLRGQVFSKRGHISGLDNEQNLEYYTNLTLGGTPISASIDTGR